MSADPATSLLVTIARIYRRLRSQDDPHKMLAMSADLARSSLRARRALMLLATADGLQTRGTKPLPHPPSEELRLRTLGSPIAVLAGSRESEVIRRPVAAPEDLRAMALPSVVADALDLGHVALAAVAPDSTAVAVLVAELPHAPTANDHVLIAMHAQTIAAALDLVTMRMRATELVAEVRRSSASMQALGQELAAGRVVLPVDGGFGLTFPSSPSVLPVQATERWAGTLTARESRIAELLVEGRSNREIADTLVLSPETVKSHVSNVLRKLGVANRAEAVARLMRLASAPD